MVDKFEAAAKKAFGKSFFDLSSAQMREIRLKFQDKRLSSEIFKVKTFKR